MGPPSFWFGLSSLTYKRTVSLLHQFLIGKVVSSCLLQLLNLWSQGQRHLCHGEDFNTRHMSQEQHASRFLPKRRLCTLFVYFLDWSRILHGSWSNQQSGRRNPMTNKL